MSAEDNSLATCNCLALLPTKKHLVDTEPKDKDLHCTLTSDFTPKLALVIASVLGGDISPDFWCSFLKCYQSDVAGRVCVTFDE